MFVAMPPDHPLAHKRNLRLADLADDPWIAGTHDCECNRLINRACAVAGFEPRIAFQTDDYTAMQGFVAAGVGVSLIAELGLTSIRDDIVVRSLGRETPVREVFAATALDAHRTPATQAMLEILTSVATRYETAPPAAAASCASPFAIPAPSSVIGVIALVEDQPAERDRDDRVDVGVRRDLRDRRVLEQPRVAREGQQRAERDQVDEPEDRARRTTRRSGRRRPRRRPGRRR